MQKKHDCLDIVQAAAREKKRLEIYVLIGTRGTFDYQIMGVFNKKERAKDALRVINHQESLRKKGYRFRISVHPENMLDRLLLDRLYEDEYMSQKVAENGYG